MKLLVITQKVDKNDPILGFFHRWLEEFAKRFESLVVICLEKGESNLPANVRVLSLGKEESNSKAEYLLRFYRYIWQERENYDAVFVHMNQEYVLLAGDLWRLWGKKVALWRNHYAGNLLTNAAVALSHKVFCTSRHSYTAKFKKTALMPVGIDTETFKPQADAHREPASLLSLGRISPSKNLHILIAALGKLHKEGKDFSAHIYGDSTPGGEDYLASLKQSAEDLGLNEYIVFHPGIANHLTPGIYRQHDLFINLSPKGMYDKTILEAAACGCRVIASSPDAKRDVSEIFTSEPETDELAQRIGKILVLPRDESRAQAQYEKVMEGHSLEALAKKLKEELS